MKELPEFLIRLGFDISIEDVNIIEGQLHQLFPDKDHPGEMEEGDFVSEFHNKHNPLHDYIPLFGNDKREENEKTMNREQFNNFISMFGVTHRVE